MNPKLIFCLALVVISVWFDFSASAAIVYLKEPVGGCEMVLQLVWSKAEVVLFRIQAQKVVGQLVQLTAHADGRPLFRIG